MSSSSRHSNSSSSSSNHHPQHQQQQRRLMTEEIMDIPNMSSVMSTTTSSSSNNNDTTNALLLLGGGDDDDDDNQSCDTLDMMASIMKGNLNSSIRDAEHAFNDVHDNNVSASFNSSGSSSSNNNRSGKKRGSGAAASGGVTNNVGKSVRKMKENNSKNKKGRRSSMVAASDDNQDIVDVPHLDDMLRSSASSSASNGNNNFRDAADAAAASSKNRGNKKKKAAIIIQDDQDDNNTSSPSRKRQRSRQPQEHTHNDSFSSKSSSLNLDMPTLSESNRNAKSSWMFESLWGGTTPFATFASSSSSVDDADENEDVVVDNNYIGDVNFEREGGGRGFRRSRRGRRSRNNYNHDQNVHGDVEGDERYSSYSSGIDQSTRSTSESRPVRLMKTLSGRVGFMRSTNSANYYGRMMDNMVEGGGFDSADNDNMGGRGRRCAPILNFSKWTMLCLFISIGVAVSIGAFVVLVPLWMEGEERMESGQLGGLAYDGGEISVGDDSDGMGGSVLDNSSSGNDYSNADTGIVDAGNNNNSNNNNGDMNGGTTQGDTSHASNSSNNQQGSGSGSTSPQTTLKPPPYNLQIICSQSTITKDSNAYNKCLSACLPSRCCLLKENETYEVWKTILGNTGDGSTLSKFSSTSNNLKNNQEYDHPIGTILTSCYHTHPDTCVHYHNQCSILNPSTLLPRKPPTKEDVANMNGEEMMELSQWIHHSCSSSSSLGAGSECELLCHEKECCFADDDANNDGKVDAMNADEEMANDDENEQNDISGGAPLGDNTLVDNGFIHMPNQNMYDTNENGDNSINNGNSYNAVTPPTLSPTIPNSAIMTEVPTYDASSYRPTSEGSLMDSFLRQRQLLRLPGGEGEEEQMLSPQKHQIQSYTQQEKQTIYAQPSRRIREGNNNHQKNTNDSSPSSSHLVHLEIPGEEGFVYIENPEDSLPIASTTQYTPHSPGDIVVNGEANEISMEGGLDEVTESSSNSLGSFGDTTVDGTVTITYTDIDMIQDETKDEKKKNCVNDSRESCMTYAGCAPLFSKKGS